MCSTPFTDQRHIPQIAQLDEIRDGCEEEEQQQSNESTAAASIFFLCCLKSLFSLSNTYTLQISLTPTRLQMCVAKICESVDFKWIGNFAEFFFVRSTLRILYMYIALDFVVVVGVVRVGSTTRPKLQVKTTNDNEEEKRSPRRNSRAINAAPHFLSFVLHSSQRGNFLYWMMPWTSTNTLITDEEWRTINF